MEVVESSCLIKKEGDTFVLYPRTKLDNATLNSFLDGRGRYVNVRLMNKVQAKSYEQTKAFWALLSLYYRCLTHEKTATSKVLQWFYEELLKDLFPVRESILSKGKFEPKHWSELSKTEGIEVINKLMILISQCEGISDVDQVSCRDLFEWVLNERSSMDIDPVDYDENGVPFSKEKWAELNQQCMVTGIQGGDICHIVSRGEAKGFEWLINQSWNLYRCNHQIHIDIQHGKPGWEGLFNGFDIDIGNGLKHYAAPWLRGRYERARRIYEEARNKSLRGMSQEEILASLNINRSEL